MLRPHLQIQLLTAAARRVGAAGGGRSQRGSIALLLLVALGVTVGSLAIANSSSNTLLRSAFQGQSRQARETALAGAETIINEWNRVENRRFLVTDEDIATFPADPADPRVELFTNSRCSANPPLPTAAAKDFGAGATGQVGGDATRTFRLLEVQRISLKDRANRIIQPGGATQGTYNEDALNISTSENNVSYIRLTVEGKVDLPGNQVATATVTREFEVVPKCCGQSFGLPVDASVAGAGVHGKDIRSCGPADSSPGEYGVVFGISGGELDDRGYTGKFVYVDEDDNQVKLEEALCVRVEDGRSDCPGDDLIRTSLGDVPKGFTYLDFSNVPAFPSSLGITTPATLSNKVTKLEIANDGLVYQTQDGTKTQAAYCGSTNVVVDPARNISELQHHCLINKISVGNDDLQIDTGTGHLNIYLTGPITKALNYAGSAGILHSRLGVFPTECNAAANNWVNNLSLFGTPTDVSPPSDVASNQEIQLQGGSELTGIFVWAPYSSVEFRGTADFCGRLWSNTLITKGNPTFIVPPTSSDDDTTNPNPALQNKQYDWIARSIRSLRLF